MKSYQLSLETKNNLKKVSKFIGENYYYVKWVPQMAEYETALVVWAKKRKQIEVLGLLVYAKSQRQDEIRTVEFSELFS
jgi:hypothetical protein